MVDDEIYARDELERRVNETLEGMALLAAAPVGAEAPGGTGLASLGDDVRRALRKGALDLLRALVERDISAAPAALE